MRSFLSLRRWLLPVILGFALLAGQALLPGRAATQVAPAAPADVMIFYAVADARIRSGYPNTNYGSEHTLQLAYSEIDVPLEDVILVRFDLSTLPPAAQIDSASLELYLIGSQGHTPHQIGAYRLTSPWSESTVTWNTYITADTTGVFTSVNDVTGVYKAWNVTSIARLWQSAPAQNYGVYLRRLTTDQAFYQRVFESREHNERIPRLVVNYRMPTPPARELWHRGTWVVSTLAQPIRSCCPLRV